MPVTHIEIPMGLSPYKATTRKLKALATAVTLDLAVAHRPASPSSRFSAACTAAYNAGQLLLAHFGFRPIERMRRDTATLPGVKALGVGTGLPEVAEYFMALRDLHHAVHYAGSVQVATEQADAALIMAKSFAWEVNRVVSQSVAVPVADYEQLLAGQARYALHGDILRLPLPALGASPPSAGERWVALRGSNETLSRRYQSAWHRGIARDEVFLVVDLHGALPCSGHVPACPADPVTCILRHGDRLEFAEVTFGVEEEDPASVDGYSFVFTLGSDAFMEDIFIFGALTCIFRHTLV